MIDSEYKRLIRNTDCCTLARSGRRFNHYKEIFLLTISLQDENVTFLPEAMKCFAPVPQVFI